MFQSGSCQRTTPFRDCAVSAFPDHVAAPVRPVGIGIAIDTPDWHGAERHTAAPVRVTQSLLPPLQFGFLPIELNLGILEGTRRGRTKIVTGPNALARQFTKDPVLTNGISTRSLLQPIVDVSMQAKVLAGDRNAMNGIPVVLKLQH